MNQVLVLEDYPDTRQWLVTIVNEAFPGCLIRQAATLANARELSKDPIDLALVDLNLPDGSGVDYIHWLVKKQPNCYIVVATIFDDEEHLFKALQAGALGYLLKEERKESLISALKGVIDGQPPLSPAIARMIIRKFQSAEKTPALTSQQTVPCDKSASLTDREEQVLNLIAKGFNRREVADYLTISAHTAASHIKSIYRKLNVSSRAEVTLEAMRLGLT